MGDVMVLINDWDRLLVNIGGTQYVKDLVGKRRIYYVNIRQQALHLMEERRRLTKAIEDGLKDQYKVVTDLALEMGIKIRAQHWDRPTSVEVTAEAEENMEQCRRDADIEVWSAPPFLFTWSLTYPAP